MWKKYKLSDIGTIVGGATPSTTVDKYYGGDIPWLTPKDLSSFSERYIERGERNITAEGLKSCSAQVLPVGSVLFSSRAPIGYIAIAKKPIATNQGFKSIIPNDKINNLFLYYLLKYNKANIESMGSGTTFKEVSGTTMKNIEVLVPSLIEQERIAKILGVLDDKIELNNRINRNLEKQALSLFRRWFVDFEFPDINGNPYKSSGGEMVESMLGKIPKEWKVFMLEDLIYFDPREKTKKNEEYLFFDMKCLSNDAMNISNGGYRLSTSSSSFRNCDTLMAKITPCLENGKTGFVMGLQENQVGKGSTEFLVMRSKNNVSPYWIYCLARDVDFRSYAIKSMTGSSGRQRVQYSKIKEYLMATNQKVMVEFHDLLASMFNQIFKLNKESCVLATLRDTLLPKLMNNEI